MKRLREYLYWAFEKLMLMFVILAMIGGGLVWWISSHEDGPDGFIAVLAVALMAWAIFFGGMIWILYRGYQSFRDVRD